MSERVEADGEPDRLAPWLREEGRVPYPDTPFPLGPLAVEGVVDWVRGRLLPETHLDERAIADKLERTTDGVPLFLRYVIDCLTQALETDAGDPGSLLVRIERVPELFTDYARERIAELREIGGEVWARDVRLLFALMSVTGGIEGGPVALSEIHQILGTDPADFDIPEMEARVMR